MGYVFIGDNTGHGSNQCSQATEVTADDEVGNVFGVTGEKEGCRYIADTLTNDDSSQPFVAGNELLQQRMKGAEGF